MDINNRSKITICILLVAMIISACTNKQRATPIPTPEKACSVNLNWHGLIPGQSTQDDVVNILGKPLQRGKLRFQDRNITYYAYEVNGGEISKYVLDRIFFRSDGVIDWMEIVEADRDGSFNTILDVSMQLGNKVDTVYSNNNYQPSSTFGDVRAGPDRIYVWAECGLALDALPSAYSPSFQGANQKCKSVTDDNILSGLCEIQPQHPNPTYLGGEPEPDVNSIVLMKFYFQPTTYEAFTNLYMYKIPFGLWDEYLTKNK